MSSHTAANGNGNGINRKVLLSIVGLFAFVVVIYVVYNTMQSEHMKNYIEASGTIETYPIEVGSRVGGRITQLSVREGDSVKKDEILVSLDPYTLPAKQLQIEGQLAQAHAILEQLLNGPRPQEILAAKAQFEAAQAQASLVSEGPRQEDIEQATASRREAEAAYNNASLRHDRFKTLLDRHVIAQQEYDDVYRTYIQAKERLSAAQQREREFKEGSRPQEIQTAQQQALAQKANYSLLKAGTRQEQIAAQRATIKQLEGQLSELNYTAEELTIDAPCNCEVNSLPVKAGQLILPNQTISTLLDLNDLWVRVYIPEERFGLVQPGDSAQVRVDAYPNKVFTGHVTQVSSEAEFTPRNVQTQETRKILVFGVKVTLDNADRMLRPGMPADVTFDVRSRENNQTSSPTQAPETKDDRS